METERGGRSLALRGVGGTGERQVGVWGRSTRELERRRPHEARVSGGRTLVEEARWRFGGGAGGEREDMGKTEAEEESESGEDARGCQVGAGAYSYERWPRPDLPSSNTFFDFSLLTPLPTSPSSLIRTYPPGPPRSLFLAYVLMLVLGFSACPNHDRLRPLSPTAPAIPIPLLRLGLPLQHSQNTLCQRFFTHQTSPTANNPSAVVVRRPYLPRSRLLEELGKEPG